MLEVRWRDDAGYFNDDEEAKNNIKGRCDEKESRLKVCKGRMGIVIFVFQCKRRYRGAKWEN